MVDLSATITDNEDDEHLHHSSIIVQGNIDLILMVRSWRTAAASSWQQQWISKNFRKKFLQPEENILKYYRLMQGVFTFRASVTCVVKSQEGFRETKSLQA
jgi:hypothetical protein